MYIPASLLGLLCRNGCIHAVTVPFFFLSFFLSEWHVKVSQTISETEKIHYTWKEGNPWSSCIICGTVYTHKESGAGKTPPAHTLAVVTSEPWASKKIANVCCTWICIYTQKRNTFYARENTFRSWSKGSGELCFLHHYYNEFPSSCASGMLVAIQLVFHIAKKRVLKRS